MSRIWLMLTIVIVGIMVLSACAAPAAPAEPPPTPVPPEPVAEPPPGDLLAHSGRLYDKWWKEISVDAPSGDNPAWALQSTNTRSDDTTWRCKECHGWDYKGKDGAYSKGSHYTGFPGLMNASDMSDDQLLSIMKGANNSDHAFSEFLTDLHTEHIVLFLKWGMIDDSK